MTERLIESACTRCNLHRDAITVKVSSRGSEKPLILFVGEAPGKTEDLNGDAFVGKAGKKLDALIEQSGIKKEWCRFTNIVRCIPHGETGGVRPPSQEEVAACRPYLEAEILSKDPIFIVPLGMSAIKFFNPTATSVSGIRGKRFYVDFPSVGMRYSKYRKWLDIKKLSESVPLVYVDKKMESELKKSSALGFPTIPTKTFTIYPTYHPAAILRGNLEYEQCTVQDLKYLKYQIDDESSVPWDSYKILRTIEEVKQACEHIKQLYLSGAIKYVVSDIETTTLEVYLCEFYELLGFCLAWGLGKSVFVPFRHKDSPFFRDRMAQAAVVSITNDLFSVVPIVNHNFKYDVHGFWKVGINPQAVYDDTMLASWTLFNSTTEHKLEALASRYTGMLSHKEEMESALSLVPKYVPLEDEYYKDDGAIPRDCIDDADGVVYRLRNYGDVSLDLLGHYCCADGDATYRLQVVFEKMLKDEGLWEAHQNFAVRSILPVARMERDGIRIDKEMFDSAAEDIKRNLANHTAWFEKHGYLEEALDIIADWVKKPPDVAKLTNSNVKKAIIYHILGFPVRRRTAKGKKPSADNEALKLCLEECLKYKGKKQDERGFYSHRIEAIKHIIQFNKDNQIYTHYLKPIPTFADKNNVVHASFGIRATDTGRFNCKNPPLQTIPYHSIVKKAFVPLHENGLILISDFSQMELRILAMVTQDPDLLGAYRDDKDLHRFIASKCYNKPEDLITKSERRNSKSVSFGVVYGSEAAGIAAQLNIAIDAAQEIIDAWMDAFPTVKRWIDRQHKIVIRDREVRTCSGFRRLFPETETEDYRHLERMAQNTPIQGPASDVAVHAANRTQEILERVKTLKSKLWCTIHDSLCFSIYPGELFKIALLARKAMIDIPTRELSWLNIMLKNDYEVGVTWGELLDMSFLPQYGHIRLEGPQEYSDRFIETVMEWDQPPEILDISTYEDKKDDGSVVEKSVSTWNFSV